MTQNITIAIPKGRIFDELEPMLKGMDIVPEEKFFDAKDRSLMFATNQPHILLIRVRSFDVATFVAFGAAQIGVVGSDVLEEFDYSDVLAPVDLGIGKCRLSLAAPNQIAATYAGAKTLGSHVRVSTKYPNLTKAFFAKQGVQAECVKLNGAMELAPKVGLSDFIVDLVSTGSTLKANGLAEVETLVDISSQLIVNRGAYKMQHEMLKPLVDAFSKAVA